MLHKCNELCILQGWNVCEASHRFYMFFLRRKKRTDPFLFLEGFCVECKMSHHLSERFIICFKDLGQETFSAHSNSLRGNLALMERLIISLKIQFSTFKMCPKKKI